MVLTGQSSPFAPIAIRTIPPALSSFYSSRPSTYGAISPLPSALSIVRGLLTDPQPIHFPILRCFKSTGREGSVLFLLKELGLDQNEADALLHRHPEIESIGPVSLESLRLRIGTLQCIGLTNFYLLQAISKRPDILVSTETGLFLNFINEKAVELPPAKLKRLLVSTHPAFFPGLVKGIRLLLNYGLPQEKLGHLLNVVNINKAFCKRSIEDIEEMILFLHRYGWPDIVVRRPQLLNLNFHSQLKPRVLFFTDLAGGDEESSAILIQKLPAILAYTAEHLQSHLEFWRSVGLTDDQVFKIAFVYPNIFSVSREGKLSSRIEFLVQCKLDPMNIFKFLTKAPLFVSLSFKDNLAKKLAFLLKLGYKYRTREMALAVGAATRTSTENMQKVIGLFFSHGFSFEDVLAMSRKHPQVLQYNCESLEKKVEFLIHKMDREVGELLSFPAFLGYKLDDRIKYRFEMKTANRGNLSINKLLSISKESFCSKSIKWVEAQRNCSVDQLAV